jgi:hypothetical protein
MLFVIARESGSSIVCTYYAAGVVRVFGDSDYPKGG